MRKLQMTENINIASLLIGKMEESISYSDFMALMDKLESEGATTGPEQKDSLINYTQLNFRRMKRWDKTFKIPEHIQELIRQVRTPMNWLVLTESWCGDAAPTMPVMNKIAELNPNIRLGILMRDEHLDLMAHFHTEGALSIPKLIVFEQGSGHIIGEWGPWASEATKLAKDFKKENGTLTAAFKEDLQRWYNNDKGRNTLEDLLGILALK